MSRRIEVPRVVLDDGGREAAGFRGVTGDCAVRSIAILSRLPYRLIYDSMNDYIKAVHPRAYRRGERSRTGVGREVLRGFARQMGWQWTPTMGIGTGCRVHLRREELPAGRLLVSCSKHVTAMIDGVIHDTYDPSRDGTRCVYGYWTVGHG